MRNLGSDQPTLCPARATPRWMTITAALALLWLVPAASANETDQFTLPLDKTFAEMGPYFSKEHAKTLQKAVDKLNRKIKSALKLKPSNARTERLAYLQSGGGVADTVRSLYAPGFFDMMDIENKLRTGKIKKQYPGQLTIHKTVAWIYADTHLPVDPRKLVLLFQSSTVKVYGSYVGVDKFGHFHDLGHIYYKDYLALRRRGVGDVQATRTVVDRFAHGPISERAVIGNMATGVMSNSDLAVNYIGFKFYRNLTEPVVLEGKRVQPMLVRDGEFWKLNRHVGPDTDFFAAFVSDHWNEALTPCNYEWGMRGPIAGRLRKNAEKILTFYADDNGRKRPRAWFERKAGDMMTYYGEDYGSSGIREDMVTIANTCFPEDDSSQVSAR